MVIAISVYFLVSLSRFYDNVHATDNYAWEISNFLVTGGESLEPRFIFLYMHILFFILAIFKIFIDINLLNNYIFLVLKIFSKYFI